MVHAREVFAGGRSANGESLRQHYRPLAARVVVIEKQTNPDPAAKIHQQNRDYSWVSRPGRRVASGRAHDAEGQGAAWGDPVAIDEGSGAGHRFHRFPQSGWKEAANVVLIGPQRCGQIHVGPKSGPPGPAPGGHPSVHAAGQLFGELASLDSDADLRFDLVSRRYQARSTLITTNRTFAEWGEVIAIEGESYRLKEAKERSGIQRGLPLLIPDNWTLEQAQAVFEVFDDLRERIWEHYAIPLQEHYRQQRMQDATDPPLPVDPDEPF